ASRPVASSRKAAASSSSREAPLPAPPQARQRGGTRRAEEAAPGSRAALARQLALWRLRMHRRAARRARGSDGNEQQLQQVPQQRPERGGGLGPAVGRSARRSCSAVTWPMPKCRSARHANSAASPAARPGAASTAGAMAAHRLGVASNVRTGAGPAALAG
ncbi:unnamed protein product, partial [Prorocentrum cordatum]